jgi:hypothetical protein
MSEKAKDFKGTRAPSSIETYFDSLLLVEPEVIIRHTQSAQSSTSPLDHTSSEHQQGLSEKAKNLWRKLKDEDMERRENRIQHISHADATKVTGHGEDGPNSNVHVNEGKGDKRSLGALLFG